MKQAMLILAAPAMLMLAPAAHAQSADGPAAFAKCALAADHAGGVALLASNPGSDESKGGAKALADKNTTCGALIGRDRGEDIVRGALAEQLYLETYASAPAAPTGTPAPFSGSGEPALVQFDLARCAVTRDPVAADALLRTGAGSAEERTAFAAVVEAVGRCTPTGAKIGFTKAKLRAGIADGLWGYRKAAAE